MNITLDELDFIWNFNPNQPRDYHGRWTSGGFGMAFDYINSMSNGDILRETKSYTHLGGKNYIRTKFPGGPKVVNDFKSEGKEIYRVVENEKQAQDYIGTGSHIGGGKHGDGHYFFNDYNDAKNFDAGYSDRRTIVARIDGSKQVTKKQLNELKEKYADRAYNSGVDEPSILNNDGAFASMIGVTSIVYPERGGVTLVVDRSSTEVLKASVDFADNSLKSRLNSLLSIWNSNNGGGNPYHDKLGKFTWSPFGCYKGDVFSAVSIYGDEYKQMIKNYDTSKFTQEEKDLINSYIASPTIGNSCDKNGRYKDVTMIFDKDGNELSSEELEKAIELYNKSEDYRNQSWEEMHKYKEEFSSKYIALRGQKTPSAQVYMLKEKYLDRDDIVTTVGEMRKKAEDLIRKKYGEEYLKMNSHDLYQLTNHGKIGDTYFSSLPERDQRAFKILHSVANAKEDSWGDKFWADDSSKTFNSLRYDRDRCYLETSYPNSDRKETGTTLQYISTLSDSKVKKYLNVYEQFNGYFRVPQVLKNELRGRELDKLIQTKGVSFDKDIVVTRRISDDTVLRQEITRAGYYIQSGFTSTTAANSMAKKSPGNMVFGDNMLKIVIPAGTKVLPIEKFARESDAGASIIRQHEILLPSETKFLSYKQEKNLPSISNYHGSYDQWDKSLELDKIDYNNNYVIPLIAITEQYAKGQ